jgi:hypothetical protein
MTINVVIDRLVLDEAIPGLPHHGEILGRALQIELARLLTDGRLAPDIMAGGHIPRVDAGVLPVARGLRADVLGQQLAQPIAGAIR